VSIKTKEISAIEKQYGPAIFRVGLAHLADVGVRHLSDGNVNEAVKQIMKDEEANKAKGVVTIMTPEFQCEIVRCAASLAQFDIWELFAYIKYHVDISEDGDGNE